MLTLQETNGLTIAQWQALHPHEPVVKLKQEWLKSLGKDAEIAGGVDVIDAYTTTFDVSTLCDFRTDYSWRPDDWETSPYWKSVREQDAIEDSYSSKRGIRPRTKLVVMTPSEWLKQTNQKPWEEMNQTKDLAELVSAINALNKRLAEIRANQANEAIGRNAARLDTKTTQLEDNLAPDNEPVMTKERWDDIVAAAKQEQWTAICLNIIEFTDLLRFGTPIFDTLDPITDAETLKTGLYATMHGVPCKVFVSKYVAPGHMRATRSPTPVVPKKSPEFGLEWSDEQPIERYKLLLDRKKESEQYVAEQDAFKKACDNSLKALEARMDTRRKASEPEPTRKTFMDRALAGEFATSGALHEAYNKEISEWYVDEISTEAMEAFLEANGYTESSEGNYFFATNPTEYPSGLTRDVFDALSLSRWLGLTPIEYQDIAGDRKTLVEIIEERRVERKDVDHQQHIEEQPEKQSSIGSILGIAGAALLGAGIAAMTKQPEVAARVVDEPAVETETNVIEEQEMSQ
jgi:hypothetical protein